MRGYPALGVEVAQQVLRFPEAVLVGGVQVEAGVGAASGPVHLGPEPQDELLLPVVALHAHATGAKSPATAASPAVWR